MHPIDFLDEDFKNYASQGSEIEKNGIQPKDFDHHNRLLRLDSRQCFLNFKKHTAGLSNNDLIRNSDGLMQNKDTKIDK